MEMELLTGELIHYIKVKLISLNVVGVEILNAPCQQDPSPRQLSEIGPADEDGVIWLSG